MFTKRLIALLILLIFSFSSCAQIQDLKDRFFGGDKKETKSKKETEEKPEKEKKLEDKKPEDKKPEPTETPPPKEEPKPDAPKEKEPPKKPEEKKPKPEPDKAEEETPLVEIDHFAGFPTSLHIDNQLLYVGFR